MGKLNGKVVIVTGSGRGLGRGFAIAMAKEGASVVVNDVDETANTVVKEIKDAGGKAVAVIAPVGSKETADKLVQTAVKEFGKLDVLVNNAGITRDAMVHKMTEKQFDEVIHVHLRGSFMNSQAAFIYMKENNVKGRIINITSGSGIYGNIGQANYSAAKAGIIGMTKANSKEFARYGICVNAVAPSAMTGMFAAIPPQQKDQMIAAAKFSITTGKLGDPEDVAPTIIFLASDESYFVTGQIISAQGCIGSF